MRLQVVLERMCDRFRPDHPLNPADTHILGVMSSEGERWQITYNRHEVSLQPGIREAELILVAPEQVFADLFDPQSPNRAAMVEMIQIRPDLPFKNFLLSLFLNAFDLTIPDLELRSQPYVGTLPFPPRYPVFENPFRFKQYAPSTLPSYDPARLPALIADEYPLWSTMWDKAWALAFNHLRQPGAESGFVANFIDIPFNGNAFLWDSCFMMLFGCYAQHHFDFLGTLDNFYGKQHDDGFICREISVATGRDVFQSLDPRSTGPNILAWTEWELYQHSQDRERLTQVFPGLVAYHRWWRDWRTHPDGSYWTCGWGSGMDNQSRVPRSEYHHRHYTWLDATLQQALSCRMLEQIGAAIGREEFAPEFRAEYEHLRDYVNSTLWDETTGFYYDRAPDGQLSRTRSIGAYWALLADVATTERRARLIAHLDDPAVFNRPHRIPSQAHDSEVYDPSGGYWLGGVWSPTNYMTLRGLTHCGAHDLAHQIALNHVQQVAQVFAETGTLWENYAPEVTRQGKPASKDFVGWTGLSAITIPLEYLIGLRPQPEQERAGLRWDVRLPGRHGVLRYRLARDIEADLICTPDGDGFEFAVNTSGPVNLDIHLNGNIHRVALEKGNHTLRLS